MLLLEKSLRTTLPSFQAPCPGTPGPGAPQRTVLPLAPAQARGVPLSAFRRAGVRQPFPLTLQMEGGEACKVPASCLRGG